MSKRLYRAIQSLLFLITFLIGFMSFYFQFVLGMEPCPLCLMQRICVIMLGMFCLMGMSVSSLKRTRLVAFSQLFFSVAGTYFAARQIWLQSLPPENIPACLPGLDLMLQYFPWKDILHALFFGAGDCAHIDWQWLGISMAGWSLLFFIGMSLSAFLLSIIIHRKLKST